MIEKENPSHSAILSVFYLWFEATENCYWTCSCNITGLSPLILKVMPTCVIEPLHQPPDTERIVMLSYYPAQYSSAHSEETQTGTFILTGMKLYN